MKNRPLSRIVIPRRDFTARLAGGVSGFAAGALRVIRAGNTSAASEQPKAKPHALTVIEGSPRERGVKYGRAFAQAIREFLQREIYAPFAKDQATRDGLLWYGEACAKAIAAYSPEIHEELGGMAEAAALRIEEAVLITLHEELYHRGVPPPLGHCTAIAAGPPDTRDGNTYVAMTWDWMVSMFGLSSMVLWRRSGGPSVMGYAYPGLWVGAGLNSAGIALCWTSASLGENIDGGGPGVGIPAYVLIAQMLYQKSLDDAIAEARRAQRAGWFTFVLADGRGELASVEGSPKRLAVERTRSRLARVYYGTREMTNTPQDKPVPYHPKCRQAYNLLQAARGTLDRPALRKILDTPPITNDGTIDHMIFNTTLRRAFVSRGPRGSGHWKAFAFE
jgi:isopenicillin-N N-acyltransferase-like protein